MIDWKRRGLQLAKAIQDGDLDQARAWAAGLQQLADLERQARDMQIAHQQSRSRAEYEPIFEQYLELVRLTNETARRLFDGQTKPG